MPSNYFRGKNLVKIQDYCRNKTTLLINVLSNITECFDSVEEEACESFDNGTSTGAVYLYRQCYNASIVAAEEFIEAFNNTIAGKKMNLSDTERVPAAQQFFK